MTKATNTHTCSEYVIVTAFARQLRLGQHAALSRYTHITALVVSVGYIYSNARICGRICTKYRSDTFKDSFTYPSLWHIEINTLYIETIITLGRPL